MLFKKAKLRFLTVIFDSTCMFFLSVSQAADGHRKTATNGHTDSFTVTQTTSQSPPYTTPLSTKTELRPARDHVVDVRQQNTVVPPPQQAHARSDKPSKFEILKKSEKIMRSCPGLFRGWMTLSTG